MVTYIARHTDPKLASKVNTGKLSSKYLSAYTPAAIEPPIMTTIRTAILLYLATAQ